MGCHVLRRMCAIGLKAFYWKKFGPLDILGRSNERATELGVGYDVQVGVHLRFQGSYLSLLLFASECVTATTPVANPASFEKVRSLVVPFGRFDFRSDAMHTRK